MLDVFNIYCYTTLQLLTCFCNVLVPLQSSCAKLSITVENMEEMKKWLVLAQDLSMGNCQLSFETFMDMIRNGRFEGFTIPNAW